MGSGDIYLVISALRKLRQGLMFKVSLGVGDIESRPVDIWTEIWKVS